MSGTRQTTVNLDESLHDLGLDRLTEGEFGKPAVPVIDDFIRSAKVMIVDDEAYTVLVVRKFLQHSGYQNFVTTTDGRQVLDLSKQELPDIVLLDGDPLEGYWNLLRSKVVVKEGRVVVDKR